MVVSQQDEKSQHKNKAKALKVLRSRVYEAEKRKKIKKDQVTEEVKSEQEIDQEDKNLQFSSRESYRSSNKLNIA